MREGGESSSSLERVWGTREGTSSSEASSLMVEVCLLRYGFRKEYYNLDRTANGQFVFTYFE